MPAIIILYILYLILYPIYLVFKFLKKVGEEREYFDKSKKICFKIYLYIKKHYLKLKLADIREEKDNPLIKEYQDKINELEKLIKLGFMFGKEWISFIKEFRKKDFVTYFTDAATQCIYNLACCYNKFGKKEYFLPKYNLSKTYIEIAEILGIKDRAEIFLEREAFEKLIKHINSLGVYYMETVKTKEEERAVKNLMPEFDLKPVNEVKGVV